MICQDAPRARCYLEVDTAAIANNLAAARELLKPETRLIAVLKADAYGYGLRDVYKRQALWTALVAFVCVKEYTVPKPDGTTQAIIVLGAQVKPDGTLSLQLQYRMELALEQYHAHPQVIVVCGAQGGNEPMTEAQAMHDYLVSNGVPEGDILMDDTSFNTRQNLTNAQKLLGDDVKKVLIVTSNYHLPRAMALARDTGFEPQGVGAPIKLIYWPKNHYREALAWVKYLLQKWSILPY